jgi:hypothetical protein
MTTAKTFRKSEDYNNQHQNRFKVPSTSNSRTNNFKYKTQSFADSPVKLYRAYDSRQAREIINSKEERRLSGGMNNKMSKAHKALVQSLKNGYINF